MTIRLRRLALVALLAMGALAAAVPAVRADGESPITADGPKKLVRYTACASGLALATSFAQAYAAILLCVSVVLDEVR